MSRITNLILVSCTLIPFAGFTAPPVATNEVILPKVPAGVVNTKAGDRQLLTSQKQDDSLFDNNRITLVVEDGVTLLVPVAKNHYNRIDTPFENPKILTVSNVVVKKEGSQFFVTTDEEKRPVSIQIKSNDVTDTRTISLALIPKPIPPKTIKLQWSVNASAATRNRDAMRWETASPYQKTIMDLSREMALGKVPSGYSVSERTLISDCDIEGVDIVPGYVIDGSYLSVIVSRVESISITPVEIIEENCYQPGVAAVTAWPHTILEPNEKTELFVIVNRKVYEDSDDNYKKRPSLLTSDVGVGL